ncbi:MAG: Gfo/Idh/MocA family oxidoreductase [Ruminococcaceae bacterium]|nr:Gfo/Idh/MocA family oxidoreductase [Oscillospiraceae bacterium]
MKVGIVGARGLSSVLGFRTIEGCEITALCDLNEDLLKQKSAHYRIPNTYRIFDDMLESDIDAVVIASPMQLHVPMAIAALEAGKHVLSEVTAGVTMDELWWLIETVEKYKKTYMLAENFIYTPTNQLVNELVKRGMFGELYYGEGEYLHNVCNLATYPNGKTSWRTFWQLGTHGTFYPTHSLGPVMTWMKDERIASIATFGSGVHHKTGLRQEDTNVTMCQLESGKLVRLRVDCCSQRPHNMNAYQLQGTHGVYESARGMGDVPKIAFYEEGNPDSVKNWRPLSDFNEYLPERYKNATEQQKKTGHWGGDYFVVKDFVDACMNGTQPPIDVYKACEWTAVALLSSLSVTNGSRILDVPNFRKNMPRSEQYIKL